MKCSLMPAVEPPVYIGRCNGVGSWPLPSLDDDIERVFQLFLIRRPSIVPEHRVGSPWRRELSLHRPGN